MRRHEKKCDSHEKEETLFPSWCGSTESGVHDDREMVSAAGEVVAVHEIVLSQCEQ